MNVNNKTMFITIEKTVPDLLICHFDHALKPLKIIISLIKSLCHSADLTLLLLSMVTPRTGHAHLSGHKREKSRNFGMVVAC